MGYSCIDDVYTDLIQFANNVYSELGAGYAECVYQRALLVELTLAGITHETEVVIPLTYRERFIGSCRADIILSFALRNTVHKMIVELKAIAKAPGEAEAAQVQTYRRSTGIEYGLAINFPQNFSKRSVSVQSLIC